MCVCCLVQRKCLAVCTREYRSTCCQGGCQQLLSKGRFLYILIFPKCLLSQSFFLWSQVDVLCKSNHKCKNAEIVQHCKMTDRQKSHNCIRKHQIVVLFMVPFHFAAGPVSIVGVTDKCQHLLINTGFFLWEQDVNLWKLMGDFNLHGITVPGEKKR